MKAKLEYTFAYFHPKNWAIILVLSLTRLLVLLPYPFIVKIGELLGHVLYRLSSSRSKIALKKLDEAVAAERAKQSEILSKAEQAGEKDLGDKQKKRDQALRDRRDVVERKVQQLNEAVDENMRDRERDWQNRCFWGYFCCQVVTMD